jgi:hypothetical protein
MIFGAFEPVRGFPTPVLSSQINSTSEKAPIYHSPRYREVRAVP